MIDEVYADNLFWNTSEILIRQLFRFLIFTIITEDSNVIVVGTYSEAAVYSLQ